MGVEVRGDFEAALRLFRKKIDGDGTLRRFKERGYGYDKPSIRKKKKHRAAVWRMERRRAARKDIKQLPDIK
jgi:ribosomal protein S21